ncbi:unnamed protein product [Clavelina lepadiformis]|uniref:Uncharacterized protein n=1 Tax=Clavelina lepadiformis TaxID=159417 RepID=A0ABP0F081_CLALP
MCMVMFCVRSDFLLSAFPFLFHWLFLFVRLYCCCLLFFYISSPPCFMHCSVMIGREYVRFQQDLGSQTSKNDKCGAQKCLEAVELHDYTVNVNILICSIYKSIKFECTEILSKSLSAK